MVRQSIRLFLTLLVLLAGSLGGSTASARTQSPGLRATPADLAKTIVHRVPRVPVVIDGVRYEPQEITRFNGRALHFVAEPQAQRPALIRAFTSLQAAQDYTRRQSGSPTGTLTPLSAVDSKAHFYQHNFSGNEFTREPGEGEPDLRRVNCFLWWCTDIDNQVSSVAASRTSSYTVLYDYYNYYGNSLWIPAGTTADVSYLSWYGWNDRASSVLATNY